MPSVLHRVHENFASALRTMSSYCGGSIAHQAGLFLYSSASPSPFPWNGAIRSSGAMEAAEIAERADAFFGPKGHGYSIGALAGIDDDLIVALGAADATSPEMVISHPPPPLKLADNVELTRIVTEAQRSDFLSVVGEAFETLGESRETWALCYPTLESLNNPESVAMVLYEEDIPAAGGMYYRSDEVIEVLHIGTGVSFRRKGYGRAVTTALTIDGFEHGASLASLQAEPMGYSTYQKIGYETISTFHWYIRPAH